jgi:hypothetical protein
MNIFSLLVDGTAYGWIAVTAAAIAGCVLTALPVVAFIHRLATCRTDRREAAEKSEHDAEERARDRLQTLIAAASTAPTWNALQAIKNEVPRMRAENPPWNTNVDTLARACTLRALELLAAQIGEELDHMAPTVTGLQPPTATPAGVMAAARMNAHAQQYIHNFGKGLREIRAVGRMLDRATFTTPTAKLAGETQPPNLT